MLNPARSTTRIALALCTAALLPACPALAAPPPPESDTAIVTRLMHEADHIGQPAKPAAAAPAADIVADTSPLIVEGIIKAPVAEVWRNFSTAEGFKALGVAQCELDLTPGGLIKTHYDPKGVIGDEATIYNRILAFEPERSLSFRIDKPPAKFPFASAWKNVWSVASFTDLGDGRTHLRLAQMGYTGEDESQKMRAFFKAGNTWVLKKLQSKYDASAASDPREPARAAHAEDPLAPIDLEVVVNAPREEVFAAYTTSAGWKSFFGTESKIELRPGGPFEIYFSMDPPAGQRGSEGCTVLSYIPGRMFSYTWNAPPQFPEARAEHTWVVLTFEDAGPTRTRVHATHLGFKEQAAAHSDRAEQYQKVRAYFAKAWPMVLGELKKKWEPNPDTRPG